MYENVIGSDPSMKAELVENLIVAHCSGSEQQFSEALNTLIKDEEKKGNMPTAARFRKAYEQKRKSEGPVSDHAVGSSAVFFSSASQTVAPRDKDSLLELYEIVYSETSLNEVVLPDIRAANPRKEKARTSLICSPITLRAMLRPFSGILRPWNRFSTAGVTLTDTAVPRNFFRPICRISMSRGKY